MKWFRLYSDVLDDPKVQLLEPVLFKAWVNLMCLANEGEPRGTLPSITDIAFRLRMSVSDAEDVVQALVDAGLLDAGEDGIEPHNWHNRQRRSDDAAARQTVSRSNRRKPDEDPPKVSRDSHVTGHNNVAPQRRIDTETETEPEAEQTNAHADAREVVAITPFAVYSAFLDETAQPDFKPAPAWKAKQIAIAARLLEQGFDADKVGRCVRFMKSQTWRTSPFDLAAVEKFIGTWEASGSPARDEPRGSPVSAGPRRRGQPDFSGIEEFDRLMDQHEGRAS